MLDQLARSLRVRYFGADEVPPRRLVEQQYGCNGAVRRRRGAALLMLGDIGPMPRVC
jgi:hypothetical protein